MIASGDQRCQALNFQNNQQNNETKTKYHGFLEPALTPLFRMACVWNCQDGVLQKRSQGQKNVFGRNRRQNDAKAIILRWHYLLKRIPATAGCMARFRPSSSTIRSWALAVTTNVTTPPTPVPSPPPGTACVVRKVPMAFGVVWVSRTSQKVAMAFCWPAHGLQEAVSPKTNLSCSST